MHNLSNIPNVELYKTEAQSYGESLQERIALNLKITVFAGGGDPGCITFTKKPNGEMTIVIPPEAMASTTSGQIADALTLLISEGCILYTQKCLSTVKHRFNTSIHYAQAPEPNLKFWRRIYTAQRLYSRIGSEELTDEQQCRAVFAAQIAGDSKLALTAREVYLDVFDEYIEYPPTEEIIETCEKFLSEVIFPQYLKNSLTWNTVSLLATVADHSDTPDDVKKDARDAINVISSDREADYEILCAVARVCVRHRRPGGAIRLEPVSVVNAYPAWNQWLTELREVVKTLRASPWWGRSVQ